MSVPLPSNGPDLFRESIDRARAIGEERGKACSELWEQIDRLRGENAELRAATARLAAPAVAEPKWPDSAWAIFHEGDGMFTEAVDTDGPPIDIDPYHRALPCRVVPADAVVIGTELLDKVLEYMQYGRNAALDNDDQVAATEWYQLAVKLRNLRAERAP